MTDPNANLNWRKCEVAWGAYLDSGHQSVVRLHEAVGNNKKTQAPLVTVGARSYRAPDYLSTKNGISAYWEVKYRRHPSADMLTGEQEFWASFSSFDDYYRLARESGTKVWIVVYCANFNKGQGQWFRALATTLRANGRRKVQLISEEESIDSWVWPLSVMELVEGPPIEVENETQPEPEDDVIAEDRIPSEPSDLGNVSDVNLSRTQLSELCQEIGLSVVPSYSVLVVSNDSKLVTGIVRLLPFGIRVFVVSPEAERFTAETCVVRHFVEARLLEYAVVNEVPHHAEAIVTDGIEWPLLEDSTLEILNKADASNPRSFNLRQYEVVHAPALEDTLVTAGAGTGKTETMSERIMFLLSTYRSVERLADAAHPAFLLPRNISLVTFTKEAAQEIQSRIVRTLVYRQRLCQDNVHPIYAWMMQLTEMSVSTIHSFAKRFIQRYGAPVGFGEEFSVSKSTMQFRSDLHHSLSKFLTHYYENYETNKITPAAHEFESFIEKLWSTVENHGVDLVKHGITMDSEERNLDWGVGEGDYAFLSRAIKETMQDLSIRFGETQRREQTLTVNQLVPTALNVALAGLTAQKSDLKFLFVDEFQDTDNGQIDLILALRRALNLRNFVVGDKKQGIYKFRGANGDAFDQLTKRQKELGLPASNEYALSKNFRTTTQILDKLHGLFMFLGSKELLPYTEEDRLVPTRHVGQGGIEIHEKLTDDGLVKVVRENITDDENSLAVICRTNADARRQYDKLRVAGIECTLVVGGEFYQSGAVTEFKAFIEAVIDNQNPARVAEVLETRWAGGLVSNFESPNLLLGHESWQREISDIPSWQSGWWADGDSWNPQLQALATRFGDLHSASLRMNVFDWLRLCQEQFEPWNCSRGASDFATDRRQYRRNVEHLMTIIDDTFGDAPISLMDLLIWLRIRVSTDKSETEPMLSSAITRGIPAAITVHKSKGLEFKTVVLPNLDNKFVLSDAKPKFWPFKLTIAQIRGVHRVFWKWSVGEREITNFDGTELARMSVKYWGSDDAEIRREEARQLYVATTRPKDKLIVFAGSKNTDTWSSFWEDGGMK